MTQSAHNSPDQIFRAHGFTAVRRGNVITLECVDETVAINLFATLIEPHGGDAPRVQ